VLELSKMNSEAGCASPVLEGFYPSKDREVSGSSQSDTLDKSQRIGYLQ
jgi:hypothetical protein